MIPTGNTIGYWNYTLESIPQYLQNMHDVACWNEWGDLFSSMIFFSIVHWLVGYLASTVIVAEVAREGGGPCVSDEKMINKIINTLHLQILD